MSIAVPLDELAERLADFPWGYLATVGDDGRARLLAVATTFSDGSFDCPAGDRTRAAATARPSVSMVFPPPDGTGYSLIVDGDAVVEGEHVRVRPTWAVLHRPALG